MSSKKATPNKGRQALGRGLGALLRNRPAPGAEVVPEPAVTTPVQAAAGQVHNVPLEAIDANPNQPRSAFDPAAIEELSRSIRADGLIQPVLLRPSGSRYLIVVGERRFRAAKLAGLSEIPAVVREIPDDQVLEIALVENIQREDLNPIEVATALQRLAHELQLSHEELAQRTGKDRTTITNLLRLLRLPADIQSLVAERRMTMGHARALLSLADEEAQRDLAEKVVSKGLSVRQVEQIVKQLQQPAEPKPAPVVDPNIAAAVDQLELKFGTRVKLVQRGKRGRIEIDYSSSEELDRIYSLLTGEE